MVMIPRGSKEAGRGLLAGLAHSGRRWSAEPRRGSGGRSAIVRPASHRLQPQPRDAVRTALHGSHEAAAAERPEQIEGAQRQKPPLAGEAFDLDDAACIILVVTD